MIVISGKKRSGKDTVANIMKQHGLECYALADPIKRALLHAFNRIKPYSMTNDMLYGINYDREQILDISINEVKLILMEAVIYTLDDLGYQQFERLNHIVNASDFINNIKEYNFSVREFMKVFGTDIICNIVSNQHWLNLCELNAPFNAVITDVRQPWEEEYFRNKNAEFVFVIGKYENYKETVDTHITELGLTPKENDHVIYNVTLEKLNKDVKCLLKNLMN